MILDERVEFADAESVAAVAGTTVVGDVVDTDGDGLEGNSNDLFAVVQVATTVITGGSAGTIEFQLVSADNDALSTNPVIHARSASLNTGNAGATNDLLKAGQTPLSVQLPRGTYKRYLGIRKVIGTTTTTAGAVDAFLTLTPPAWKALPDAVPTPA